MSAVRPTCPVPGPRRPNPARRSWLAAGALSLAACRPASDPGPDQPAGPMYQCLGEAPYAASWDEIMAEYEKDPPDCSSREPAAETGEGTGLAMTLTNDPAGNPLPTGEYYLNMEVEYADRIKDTSCQKFGFIRSPCAR